MPSFSFILAVFLVPVAIGTISRAFEGRLVPPKYGRLTFLAITYSFLLILISNRSLLIDSLTLTPIPPTDQFIAVVGSFGMLGMILLSMFMAYSFAGRVIGSPRLESSSNGDSDQ
jgi:hypothetical protein